MPSDYIRAHMFKGYLGAIYTRFCVCRCNDLFLQSGQMSASDCTIILGLFFGFCVSFAWVFVDPSWVRFLQILGDLRCKLT